MILPAYAYKDHLDVSDRLGIAHTYPRLGLTITHKSLSMGEIQH